MRGVGLLLTSSFLLRVLVNTGSTLIIAASTLIIAASDEEQMVD